MRTDVFKKPVLNCRQDRRFLTPAADLQSVHTLTRAFARRCGFKNKQTFKTRHLIASIHKLAQKFKRLRPFAELALAHEVDYPLAGWEG